MYKHNPYQIISYINIAETMNDSCEKAFPVRDRCMCPLLTACNKKPLLQSGLAPRQMPVLDPVGLVSS